MKGLLYKEFKLCLPTIIIYGAIQLALTILSIIMAFLGEGNEEDAFTLLTMLVFFSVAVYFLFSLMPLTTFTCDATHAWQNFSVSAPTGAAGQVGSKYIIMLSSYIFAFIMHTLQFIVISLVTGINFYTLIFLDVFLMSIFLIISVIEYPFFFAFGFEKGQIIKGTSLLTIIFLALIYVLFGNLSFLDSPNPLITLLAYVNSSAIIFVPVIDIPINS